ncbi:MAG: VCBS repeat-containing protein [Candidatus Hydrogenedentes bacterium]|nr:VCBS repeat-containing protein [Candidatus Hydrogenedentota bacterium]
MYDSLMRVWRPPVALLLFAVVQANGAEGFPAFEKHTIDTSFDNGYQVSVADVDCDGKPDILALSTTPSKLVWYRNSTWERYTISSVTERNIDLAPYDVDGDGDQDLAVASAFDLGDSTQGGLVQWLECPADPVRDQEWKLHPIDALPTSHRVRWADIDGDGRKELLNLPIIGVGASAPEYAAGVQFKAYIVPGDLQAEAWNATMVDDSLHMAHGLLVARWNGDARDDVLTASFEGVHVYVSGESGFTKQHLGEGHVGERPKQGSSEVGAGMLAKDGPRFVATIEPWHGHEVVVYTPRTDGAVPWTRGVIDSSFKDGHALLCTDLDKDGTDEIVAGYRGEGTSLYIYRYDSGSASWVRLPLDEGGMAAAGLYAADIDQDGWPDIAAIGTSTNNVVWYENQRD